MDADLIQYTEYRARDLGLRYTQAEAPAALLRRVGSAEDAIWLTLSDEDFPSECFGLLWGGYKDADCAECQIQTRCLQSFATDYLPKKLGNKAWLHNDPYALCKTIGVPPASIITARLYADEMAGLCPTRSPRPYRLISSRDPSPIYLKPRLPYVEAARAALLGAEAAIRPWPRPMPGVRHRAGIGLECLYPPIRFTSSEHRARPDRDADVWRQRHDRERNRAGALGELPVGTVLRRMYQGWLIEVELCSGHWAWRDRQYPTLYDAVMDITGPREYERAKTCGTRTMSDWSAKRFFHKAFAQFERTQKMLGQQTEGLSGS